MPPAGAWNGIQNQLHPDQTPVVPLRAKFFQYAVAAAVVLLLVIGGVLYFSNRTEPDVAYQTQNPARKQPANDPRTSAPSKQTPESTFAQNNRERGEIARVNFGTDGSPTHAVVHLAPQVELPGNELASEQIAVAPEEKTYIDTELQSRYMIATTASGKVVRLPKKAYSDYACAERFQNYQCRERIEALQSKLAATVATDFTDFMDLLKNLQEPQ